MNKMKKFTKESKFFFKYVIIDGLIALIFFLILTFIFIAITVGIFFILGSL